MGAVGKLFGGGQQTPQLMPSPVLPPPTAPTITPAMLALRDRNRMLAGMSGTIKTSGLGIKNEPKTAKKTLLGE